MKNKIDFRLGDKVQSHPDSCDVRDMKAIAQYSRGRKDGHAKKGYVPMILEEEPKDSLLLLHPDGIKIVWMGEPVPVKYAPGNPRGLSARRKARAKALKMAKYHLGNY